MSKDKIGLSRIVDLYGEGAYFVFYSKYVMTDEEIESGYENYFAFTKNELKKTPICGNTYSIVRKSLSYYDEGGHVHILIKCD
jgi:hypothetical protein